MKYTVLDQAIAQGYGRMMSELIDLLKPSLPTIRLQYGRADEITLDDKTETVMTVDLDQTAEIVKNMRLRQLKLPRIELSLAIMALSIMHTVFTIKFDSMDARFLKKAEVLRDFFGAAVPKGLAASIAGFGQTACDVGCALSPKDLRQLMDALLFQGLLWEFLPAYPDMLQHNDLLAKIVKNPKDIRELVS